MREDFEGDENKRTSNLGKHKIDFNDAIRIFNDRPVVHVPSEYPDEDRWLTIGELSGRKIMVVCTWRGSTEGSLPPAG